MNGHSGGADGVAWWGWLVMTALIVAVLLLFAAMGEPTPTEAIREGRGVHCHTVEGFMEERVVCEPAP